MSSGSKVSLSQPPPYSRRHNVLSALAYTCGELADAENHATAPTGAANYNDLARFLLVQQSNLPDYLQFGIRAATALFDAAGLPNGGFFHSLHPAKRQKQVLAWKHSRLGFQRDLIRYYESLSTLALFSRDQARCVPPAPTPASFNSAQVIRNPDPETTAEIVVVGSGPGGAITACTLAEVGRDVLLVEEGPLLSLDSCAPFSRDEMLQKYRNGGQNVALEKDKVAYVEGRCVGGGSEINSGLYHRTPPEILEKWSKDFGVEALALPDLLPHFEQCEKDVSVSLLKAAAPAASLKLHEGAARLSWKSVEAPRWFAQDPSQPGGGRRQSMTETFIPRFLKAGGRLMPDTRASRLRYESGRWTIEATHNPGRLGETTLPNDRRIRITAGDLFLAGGAIQTPVILLRSGIRNNVGHSLQLHPTVKVVAHFPDEVNSANMGVPVHQVKEFAPRVSFGCSISSPAYLALGLLDRPKALQDLRNAWTHMANYYAMSSGTSSGSIRLLPGFSDPLVRYTLTNDSRADLAKGLRDLCRLLLEAGADRLFPGPAGSPEIASARDLETIPQPLPPGSGNLMTIHLFSSCPMGERKDRCVTNSFGRIHGLDHLYISDASLLCTAPGVNPQGSIMAIARRNALAFLRDK